MVYVDTSALVPFFIREPKSEALIAWLESSGERLAVSEWCSSPGTGRRQIVIRSSLP